jgi:DNA-binding response OmpR family regulator
MAFKIVYIEDDPQQVEIIRLFLLRDNIEVIGARDAQSGWQAIHVENPSLILLDINLPSMTGIEIAEQLRAEPAYTHIPLVALTSTMKYSHDTPVIESLFDAYMSKPIKRSDILETIRNLVGEIAP